MEKPQNKRDKFSPCSGPFLLIAEDDDAGLGHAVLYSSIFI